MRYDDRIMVFFDRTFRRKGIFRFFVICGVAFLLLASMLVAGTIFSVTSNNKAVELTEVAKAYYYYQLPINEKKLALTFDDGPNPEYTAAILNVLEQHNAHGTFFMIGSNVAKYPEVAQSVVDRGFAVGNHTYTHSHDVHATHDRLALELRLTDIVIKNTLGVSPTMYRAPFLLTIGKDPTINPNIILQNPLSWAVGEGYFPVGADIDPQDWLTDDVRPIEERFMTELARGGHIVLLHDGPSEHHHATVGALDDMIQLARNEGFTFVPLSELYGPTGPVTIPVSLALDSTGSDVSMLQWVLFAQEFLDPNLITGTFDENTAEALTEFQTAHKLAATGAMDAATQSAIQKISWERDYIAKTNTSLSLGEYFSGVAFSYQKWMMVLMEIVLALAILRLGFLLVVLIPKRGRREMEDEQLPNFPGGVSVVVPAYNESANVGATLESILRNDFAGPLEIIVIDDGSSDDTAAYVRQVAAFAPSRAITLILKKNGGKARALNIGFREAKYDVVVAIDGDAVLAPEAIRLLARHFTKPEVAAVAGKVYTAGRRDIFDAFQRIEYIIGQNIEKKAFDRIGGVGVVPGVIGAWRKKAVLSVGGFKRDTLVEDQDITMALLRRGGVVRYEENAIAYTETPHSIGDFMKQRFRWVYGTFQCLWKHKFAFVENVGSPISAIVLPTTLVFGMILPLLYPIIDIALLAGMLSGQLTPIFVGALMFTVVDIVYAMFGLWGERGRDRRLILLVPIQRFLYRPLIWYAVAKSFVRAIEGTHGKVTLAAWDQVAKTGDVASMYTRTFTTEPQVAAAQSRK